MGDTDLTTVSPRSVVSGGVVVPPQLVGAVSVSTTYAEPLLGTK